MRPPQFSIRDVIWLTIVVALLVGIVLEWRQRSDIKIILQARRDDVDRLRQNRDLFADLEVVYSTILTASQKEAIREHFEMRQDSPP
jgi:hypothetical protein